MLICQIWALSWMLPVEVEQCPGVEKAKDHSILCSSETHLLVSLSNSEPHWWWPWQVKRRWNSTYVLKALTIYLCLFFDIQYILYICMCVPFIFKDVCHVSFKQTELSHRSLQVVLRRNILFYGNLCVDKFLELQVTFWQHGHKKKKTNSSEAESS